MNLAHFAEIVAKTKTGNIEGWEAFSWKMHDDKTCEVTGGVPTFSKTGKKSWKGDTYKAYVVQVEIEMARKKYESETGNCAECLGEGRHCVSYSSGGGRGYESCSKCFNGRVMPMPEETK